MGRNRKEKRQKLAEEKDEDESSESGGLELTEEEQWRIVSETGILNKLPAEPAPQPSDEDEEDASPFADEIFQTTCFAIPMTFMLLLMEILVHWQYGKRPTYAALADRMVPGLPILSIFILYTNRYKRTRWMQLMLFFLSLAVGPRLIWLLNMASWRVVMQQCPPLSTLWVYTVLQLDLGPAFFSLVLVGGWLWWSGMKLVL